MGKDFEHLNRLPKPSARATSGSSCR